MTLVTAENITRRFRDQTILERVSFAIQQGERIALVGRNGIGKTTLLEIIAGRQSIDEGVVNRSRECRIDYLEQEKGEYFDQTLHDFVADARADLVEMHRTIEELQHYLEENPSDRDQLERLGTLQQEFERRDGFDFDALVTRVLEGLGFSRDRFGSRLRNFSGGEKNRAGLARLLAGQGNLLLLDEPTNHLDIDSTVWLENYLKELDKAVVIVSHDRAFLGATTDRVWEMTGARIETYTGGIERYLEERVERREQAAHRYRHQQEEIERIEEFIRRNMAGQKTRQAQSKLKYLSRIKRLPAPRTDERGPSITMRSSGRSHAHVLSVEDVYLDYGGEPVVEEVAFHLYRGDKVGLIGHNGSGKSTLLKALIGEIVPSAGLIRLGNNIDVAYFDQELSYLDENVTVIDNLWQVDLTADAETLRSFLARFGFSGDDVLKRVSALSGGEKTKVCLARLLYYPANFIIMDEPTNHLDLPAREALETALQRYDGTCLIVSHDRYFLDKVVDKIIHLNQRRARLYDGNYSRFLEKITAAAPLPPPKEEKSRDDYLAFHEKSKRRARLKKNITITRQRLADAEEELGRLAAELEAPSRADDWEHLKAVMDRKAAVEEEVLAFIETLERLEATDLD